VVTLTRINIARVRTLSC